MNSSDFSHSVDGSRPYPVALQHDARFFMSPADFPGLLAFLPVSLCGFTVLAPACFVLAADSSLSILPQLQLLHEEAFP